jgi:uncharacterized repeat protein (TIGR03803 family)
LLSQTHKQLMDTGGRAMTHKLVMILAVVVLATGAWATTETVLWNFNPANGNPGNPFANNLIFDGSNFYGVTWEGGETAGCLNGCGTVFELSPNSNGGWSETLLYSFDPVNGDGSNPLGGLVRDQQGNLYGTTYFGGGSASCDNGCGTVFELTPGSNGWTEAVLYRFTGGADGNYPYSTLTIDKTGSLYGTTYGAGGTSSLGTVYQLSLSSTGGWAQTTLHGFAGTSDGSNPLGPVVFDKMGRLYGTTSAGGTYGYGNVYQLNPLASGWTLTVLHDFNSTDGAFPAWVGLTIDQGGNLYGTTENGGPNNTGTVWELLYSASQNDYSEKVLYNFGPKGDGDGNYPWAGVTMPGDGILFGTTAQGGPNNWGTIFALAKDNRNKWKEKILYSFTGGEDGGQPSGDLLKNGSGPLYGIAGGGGASTAGVVFEIAP